MSCPPAHFASAALRPSLVRRSLDGDASSLALQPGQASVAAETQPLVFGGHLVPEAGHSAREVEPLEREGERPEEERREDEIIEGHHGFAGGDAIRTSG